MDFDVIVVGGGPVGALLAAELRLGGARAVVLERLTEPSGHSKAFRLQPRTLELFDQRGILERFLEGNRIWPRAHFAGIEPLLELDRLDAAHPHALLIPQARTEELLEKHALDLGAEIRRGHELTGLATSGDEVVARVRSAAGEYELRAPYLVGCDGGRSTVRRLAGIGFTGTDPSVSALLGDVELPEPGQLPAGVPGTMRTPRGLLMAISVLPGVTRVLTTEFDKPLPDRDAPVTLDELRTTVERITGLQVTMREPRWLSRFTDATRLADEYGTGRVLLAGDAAHVHFPIGAQGLNLGLQDAMNLGWKLAATVAGWAPDGLLDSYGAERRPAAVRVLRETRAQVALMNPEPRVDALRDLVGDLLALPEVNLWLSRELSGLDVRYETMAGDADHPLVGRPCPALTADAGAGPVPAATLLRTGHGLLLLPTDAATAAAGWSDRVDVLPDVRLDAGARDDVPAALLLRPDGHVAWAGAAGPDEAGGLTAALHRWFGAPHELTSTVDHAQNRGTS
ncbi:FAD-dependent monooxygenase [Nucisporomicrobium flavum]|uniref:FAD-dependent monooxygenase n=1 Tax=Nucisporomicrobium flavum TaxID=2785915 RepID=UPI003C2ABB6C